MKYMLFGLLGMLTLAAAPSVARAGGHSSFSIGVGFSNGGYHGGGWGGFVGYSSSGYGHWGGGGYGHSHWGGGGYGYSGYGRYYAPAYCAPRVSYYAPAYCPPPVVYAPAPVVYAPAPVVYAPAPVYYAPAAPAVYQRYETYAPVSASSSYTETSASYYYAH
jgi:hypothetical protein